MSYKKPEMEVIRFECSDIVAASSGTKTLTISGMGNTVSNDNRFVFGTYDYTYGTTGVSSTTVRNSLSNYFEDDFSKVTASNLIFYNEDKSKSTNLNILWGGQTTTAGFNGKYEYDGPGSHSFTMKN